MASQGWHIDTERSWMPQKIVITRHARMRIKERLNLSPEEVQEAAKEVGRIYYNFYYGTKAEIEYKDSIWVVKTAEDKKALVKTVLSHKPDYSMKEFLGG